MAIATRWTSCRGRGKRHVIAVRRPPLEERAAGSRFRMGGHFVWGLGKTSLYLRKIKETIVCATGDIAQPAPGQIDHHREISILTIQSEDDSSKGKRP